MEEKKHKLLFLCTGNQARSQMAEAILRHKAGDRFDVSSAGSSPQEHVHPLATAVLREIGIDISNAKPKHVKDVINVRFDVVITLCDQARDACPLFPGNAIKAHWDFEDPAAFEGTEEEKIAFFRKIRDAIGEHITRFLELPSEKLTGENLHRLS